MSNIFSTRSYVLPNGVKIDLPRGISVGPARKDLIYVVYRKHDRQIRKEGTKSDIANLIKDAVIGLRAAIKAGDLPGGYHARKRTGTPSDDLPPGMTLHNYPPSGDYRLYISYPDVVGERLGHTNYYVGNENTYLNNYDAVIKRARTFRKQQLKAYTKEFLKRLDLLIVKLTERGVAPYAKTLQKQAQVQQPIGIPSRPSD